MRRLMLLRHAKAEPPHNAPDHDRSLVKIGLIQSATMGSYMAVHGLIPDLAVVSTARRAQETWQGLRPAFTTNVLHHNEARLYEASAHEILQVIKDTSASVRVLLLVGHNPGFERLAANLTDTGHPAALRRLQAGCPPAGLAVIDFSADSWVDVSAHSGQLERFETPESVNDKVF